MGLELGSTQCAIAGTHLLMIGQHGVGALPGMAKDVGWVDHGRGGVGEWWGVRMGFGM